MQRKKLKIKKKRRIITLKSTKLIFGAFFAKNQIPGMDEMT